MSLAKRKEQRFVMTTCAPSIFLINRSNEEDAEQIHDSLSCSQQRRFPTRDARSGGPAAVKQKSQTTRALGDPWAETSQSATAEANEWSCSLASGLDDDPYERQGQAAFPATAMGRERLSAGGYQENSESASLRGERGWTLQAEPRRRPREDFRAPVTSSTT